MIIQTDTIMISVCRPQSLWNRLPSQAIKGLRPFMWGVAWVSIGLGWAKSRRDARSCVSFHGRASYTSARLIKIVIRIIHVVVTDTSAGFIVPAHQQSTARYGLVCHFSPAPADNIPSTVYSQILNRRCGSQHIWHSHNSSPSPATHSDKYL